MLQAKDTWHFKEKEVIKHNLFEAMEPDGLATHGTSSFITHLATWGFAAREGPSWTRTKS
jgi:hypothetical protein